MAIFTIRAVRRRGGGEETQLGIPFELAKWNNVKNKIKKIKYKTTSFF